MSKQEDIIDQLSSLNKCISGIVDTQEIIIYKLRRIKGVSQFIVYPHAYQIPSGYCQALSADIVLPILSADTQYLQLKSTILPQNNDVIINWGDYDNEGFHKYLLLTSLSGHVLTENSTINDISNISTWDGFYVSGHISSLKDQVKLKIQNDWFNHYMQSWKSDQAILRTNGRALTNLYYLKHQYKDNSQESQVEDPIFKTIIDTEDTLTPHKYKIEIAGFDYTNFQFLFQRRDIRLTNLTCNIFGKYVIANHVKMFTGICRDAQMLINADLSSINLRLIQNFMDMFYGCYNLKKVLGFTSVAYNIANLHNIGKVYPLHALYDHQYHKISVNNYFGNMFRDCISLQETDFQIPSNTFHLNGIFCNNVNILSIPKSKYSSLKIPITKLLPEVPFLADRTILFFSDNSDLFLQNTRILLEDNPSNYIEISNKKFNDNDKNKEIFYYLSTANNVSFLTTNITSSQFYTIYDSLKPGQSLCYAKPNSYISGFPNTIPRLEQLFWKNNGNNFGNPKYIFKQVIWDKNYIDQTGKHISSYIPEQWGGGLLSSQYRIDSYNYEPTIRYNKLQKGGSKKYLSSDCSDYKLIDNIIYIGTRGFDKDYGFISYDNEISNNTNSIKFIISGFQQNETNYIKQVDIYLNADKHNFSDEKLSGLITGQVDSNIKFSNTINTYLNIQDIQYPKLLIPVYKNYKTCHMFKLKYIPPNIINSDKPYILTYNNYFIIE